jgi:dihydrodipicolinate synthase/N-acetylneuraminate lyase
MMDGKLFRGVGPAVITAMRADGSLDWDGYARHVEFRS